MTKIEKSEIGRALNALRKTYAGGRPKKLRKCKLCGLKLGAREMRMHKCEDTFLTSTPSDPRPKEALG